MIWQLWVIIIYAIVNLILSAYILGTGKEVKLTGAAVSITALWYGFIIWTIIGLT